MQCHLCPNKIDGKVQGYFKDYACSECINKLNEAEQERQKKKECEEG